MFNPLKVQLSCNTSISTEEREKFLEFVKSQLQMIGCDRVEREGSQVIFSNNVFSPSRWQAHPMSAVDGGVFAFAPVNQLIYEYRVTTLGIIMLIFVTVAVLIFRFAPIPAPDFFPFAFFGMAILVTTINWAIIRHRQKKFMQQLEPEYQRMKQVFSQSR